ncbi:MAG: hypothetical protein OXE77_11920 [Flavobacteriaceae bacterium]|nr:hypothetical protein [Flavobacteriaceae bacterium]MCY4266764.1 hypothetical protein [Flavobacteriaceae bacterium]
MVGQVPRELVIDRKEGREVNVQWERLSYRFQEKRYVLSKTKEEEKVSTSNSDRTRNRSSQKQHRMKEKDGMGALSPTMNASLAATGWHWNKFMEP